MKKNELNELKSKSIQELEKKLKELEKQMIESKIQLKMGKLKNMHRAGNFKKDIARIKTILKIKGLVQINQSREVKSHAAS